MFERSGYLPFLLVGSRTMACENEGIIYLME